MTRLPMPPAIEHFETLPGLANGAVAGLCVHYNAIPHDMPMAESFERALRRMNHAFGPRYALLFVSHLRRSGTPESSVRARLLQTMRDSAILPAASALTVLSPGLLGVTGRSVITGLLLAARLSVPVRVFGKVGDSLDWLVRQAREQMVSLPPRDVVDAALAELQERAHGALTGGPR